MMEIASVKWSIFYLTLGILSFTFCGLSLATATAMSVDTLLALLLGLRYRHTVTLRRVRCLVVCFLFANTATGFAYSLSSQDFGNSAGFVLILSSLFLSVFSHVKIFFKLRQHQAQVRHQHVGHEQADNQEIPLNIERFKKTVSTIAWMQLALVFCYSPMLIFMILSTMTTADCYKAGSIFNVSALGIVYLNSTLNPILFCWKLREVKQAVKTTLKQIRCFSS